MTNAALADLQARISSNTLTFAQQTFLANALALIIPIFPSIDETSAAVTSQEDIEVRDAWIAPLYALSAQAAGGTTVDPRTVTAWYVSTATGNDANSGTSPAFPLKTFAALASLWRGAQPGGGRPTLTPSSGTTITINVVGDHAIADPLAPVLDVDLAGSTRLLFVGGTVDEHSGALTTVSAFARTSAAGQVTVTSAGVADFSIYFGLLLDDTTKGITGWVYGPDGASSANGEITSTYTSQTAGNLTAPTQVTMSATDAYTIRRLFVATVGSGFQTRSYPATAGSPASVVFYRLALTQATTGDAIAIDSPGVSYVLQECSIEGNPTSALNTSSIILQNSLVVHASVTSETGSAVEGFFGGGIATGSLFAQLGGEVIVDSDFLISGTGAYTCQGGTMVLGAVGRFGTGPAVVCFGGTVIVETLVTGVGVVYGTNTGACVEALDTLGDGSTVQYLNSGSGTPAADAFKLSTGTLEIGTASNANAFGFNEGTGAYVGPTAATVAHLDAALAAGTGFGGVALDPANGCSIRIAA